MNDSNPSGGTNLADELSAFGKNLIDVLRAAWDRPERQKLQQEIESGISELGSTLRKEAQSVSDSQVGQRIKAEVDDLSERVRSGQVETKVREELINALQTINLELAKVVQTLSDTEIAGTPGETASPQGDSKATDVPTETPTSEA